jgi:histidine triad (HIT) family protein
MAEGAAMPARPCVFCRITRGEQPAVVVYEDDRTMAFLDDRPVFHGHTLLVPKVHVQVLADLPAGRVEHFFLLAQRLERAVERGLDADGSMVLVNNVVSQSVPHLHLHVIPRRRRDGLRFWLGPRHPYTSQEQAEATARRIRETMPAAAGDRD